MDETALAPLNQETQSIRGRACPVCGGKIIPSDRAVYQNAAAPEATISIWQCERCGHEEIFERKRPAKAAKPASAKTTGPDIAKPSKTPATRGKGQPPPLPPDVRAILDHMSRPPRDYQ